MNSEDLVNLFYEIGTLRNIKRSYIQHMYQDVESVAEHSHRVAIIALILSYEVGSDPYKTLIMALFHDLSESRTSDLNWLQKQYANIDEDKAQLSQLKLMGKSKEEISKLLNEYHDRKSLESRVAKDADCIDYFLGLQELSLQGNKEAARRLKEDMERDILYTEEAKKLYDQIMKTLPNEWYQKDRQTTHNIYKTNKKEG